MPRDSLDELSGRWQDLEDLVDATPGIDPWCSGPDWVLPAHRAFATEHDPILQWDERGALLLNRYRDEVGQSVVAGLEPLWGFASPLLGPDLAALASALADRLRHDRAWDVLVISGLPLSPELAASLAEPFSSAGTVRAVYGISRRTADLGSGADEWFARRSARFRQTLRRSERIATARGVGFVDISEEADAFERCVAIERRSWKGEEHSGILGPEMHSFYADMTARLRDRRRFRAMVATLDGEDVGFIFGGIRAGRYRGLQLSQIEGVRHLAVGHLLQLRTIRALEDEPVAVTRYDLGMDMEYKRRWADHEESSMAFIVERRRQGARRWIG